MQKWRGTNTEHQEQTERLNYEERDEQLLDILNHHRHNWLNDLQLIFGYVKLKKYDQLENFMDKLREKIEDESSISRIAIPSLALDLMSYRYTNHLFKLKVDMAHDLLLSYTQSYTRKIHEILMDSLHVFEHICFISQDKTNELNVNISGEDERIMLMFEYNGSYNLEEFEHRLVSERLRQREQGNDVQWTNDNDCWRVVILMAKPF